MEVRDIKMSDIRVSDFNIRKDIKAGTEDTGLDDLAESIKDKGLLNPLIVRSLKDETYDLIAGQRRYLACKKLGWTVVPAIIRDVSDDTDVTILSLVENVHRADLNPMDKARAYQTIQDKYNDFNKVAKETGVSVSTIKKYLSLLKLSPAIQKKVSTNEGAAGIGTLSKLAEMFSPEEQEEVIDRIGGFKQDIQLEMLRRSGGNVSELEELRTQAFEGAFDTRICRGIDECQFIPEELQDNIKGMIRDYNKKKEPGSFKDMVKKLK